MKNILSSVLIALVSALAVVAIFGHQAAPASGRSGGVGTFTTIGAATTTASIAVTSSTRVLATTTANGVGYVRAYATICNPNANPVYLLLNNDKPASNAAATAVIAAAAGYNACYTIASDNHYNGSVQASSTNQTSTSVTVSDYVQ
jgi:hypothetical protein